MSYLSFVFVTSLVIGSFFANQSNAEDKNNTHQSIERIKSNTNSIVKFLDSRKSGPQAHTDIDFLYKAILENHPAIYNKKDIKFKLILDLEYLKAKIKEANLDLFDNFSSSLNKKFANSKSLTLNKPKRRIHDLNEKRWEILEDFANSFKDNHLKVLRDAQFTNQSSQEKRSDKVSFEINEFKPGIIWIKLPTFFGLNRAEEKKLKQIIDKLKKLSLNNYLNSRNEKIKIIVFDVRGNTGGNSQYGSQILSSIVGKKTFKESIDKASEFIAIDWRASPGNFEHIYTSKQKILKTGLSGDKNSKISLEIVSYLEKIELGILRAIFSGKPYFRENFKNMTKKEILIDKLNYRKSTNNQGRNFSISRKIDKQLIEKDKSSDYLPKLVGIIDSNNGSSANTFLDELKIVQRNSILIGEPTANDTLYSEVRLFKLPISKGILILPIKVFRNRIFRGNRKRHLPDVYVDLSSLKKDDFLKKKILSFI